MRTLIVLGLAAVSIAGCARSAPLQPDQTTATQANAQSSTAVPASTVAPPSNAAVSPMGKPEIDPTYANGTTVYMIGPHLIVNAKETMPNAYEHAEELYLVVYPQQSIPQPGAGPITLPSGYQPLCNPCFHPGLPLEFVYHDHVIPGAPGMGNNGTSDGFKAPWKIIVLVYNPEYASSPNFVPLKSEADIDAAEAAGNVFLPINNGGGNPYEIDTGNLLICPIVSNHA
jgi:hypothetical protein